MASTLRRKAFHRGGTRSSSEQNKAAMAAAAAAAAAMTTDGVQVTSCSPSASRRSSRSSSFAVQVCSRPADVTDDRSAAAQVAPPLPHCIHCVLCNSDGKSRDTVSFSQRVVQKWSKLAQEVVDATSVNQFKNRLDTFWQRYGY